MLYLSHFSLLAEFLIQKAIVKDRKSRVLTLLNLKPVFVSSNIKTSLIQVLGLVTKNKMSSSKVVDGKWLHFIVPMGWSKNWFSCQCY
jgi:hypothetical protein